MAPRETLMRAHLEPLPEQHPVKQRISRYLTALPPSPCWVTVSVTLPIGAPAS